MSSQKSTGAEPIVMMVEEPVEPAEVVLIVRHLQDQGFRVRVASMEPLELHLTCPSERQPGEE